MSRTGPYSLSVIYWCINEMLEGTFIEYSLSLLNNHAKHGNHIYIPEIIPSHTVTTIFMLIDYFNLLLLATFPQNFCKKDLNHVFN